MIKIPVFDPSNLEIKDKLDFVKNNLDLLQAYTGYEAPVGYINFVLPGFVFENPNIKINPISPYLIDQALVADFYDKDIMLYINYFGSLDDCLERIDMYTNDYIIKEKRVSPSWKIVVFMPQKAIDSFEGQGKFNLKYGVHLLGEDITLENIKKINDRGIHHFNLIFMDINKDMKLMDYNETIINQIEKEFPESQFLIYAKNSDKLNLKSEAIRAVVGASFWKQFPI
jgi:hypothetical protein